MKGLSCFVALALTSFPAAIDAYRVNGITLIGYGSDQVTPHNPTAQLEPGSFIDRISCKGGDRLDYLKVTHARWSHALALSTGKLFKENQVFEYGQVNGGHWQGYLYANGGYLSDVKVWLCNPGHYRAGHVCGMSFKFSNSDKVLMCGKAQKNTNDYTFGRDSGIKAFISMNSETGGIAAIGWSLYK